MLGMQNSSSFFQGQARFSNGFFGIYHSPFGVELKGRNLKKNNAKNYRFGFQGQEGDDQIKGDGNSVNYKYRMHDPRLGRFFAVDPLAGKYPHNSTYAFSENVVIHMVELEGLESAPSGSGSSEGTGVGSCGGEASPVKTREYKPVGSTFCDPKPIVGTYMKIVPITYGWSVTIGDQPLESYPGEDGNGTGVSDGKPLMWGFGAIPYTTISKHALSFKNGVNDGTETNHQFGFGYTTAYGLILEALYSKQKIKGNFAGNGSINYEAPGNVIFSAGTRFAIGYNQFSMGLSPLAGVGVGTGKMRYPGSADGDSWKDKEHTKVMGFSAAIALKADISYSIFTLYARAQLSYYHMNAQNVNDLVDDGTGNMIKVPTVQGVRKYGTFSITAGITIGLFKHKRR
jgi:RHS repeat-associated protein